MFDRKAMQIPKRYWQSNKNMKNKLTINATSSGDGLVVSFPKILNNMKITNISLV